MSERVHAALDWKVFLLSGPDRKAFLHGLVTSDVKNIRPGRELPSCLLTPKGRLQAHFWAFERPEALALICPAETAGALSAALRKVLPLSESKLEDLSDKWSVYWTSGATPERGLPFSALGAGGQLVLVEPAKRASFAASAGRELSAEELEARRVEAGLPRFGVDMDEETIPLEARLDAAISYTKGCYMGQETISRIHHLGHVNRLLVALRFEGEPPAVPASVEKEGKETGRLTSVSRAARLGLATVRREDAVAGARVAAGGKPASVVDLWRA